MKNEGNNSELFITDVEILTGATYDEAINNKKDGYQLVTLSVDPKSKDYVDCNKSDHKFGIAPDNKPEPINYIFISYKTSTNRSNTAYKRFWLSYEKDNHGFPQGKCFKTNLNKGTVGGTRKELYLWYELASKDEEEIVTGLAILPKEHDAPKPWINVSTYDYNHNLNLNHNRNTDYALNDLYLFQRFLEGNK